jgi:hypothetical protein
MSFDFTANKDKNISNIDNGSNKSNNQEFIVVDGRGYENSSENKEEIYNLIDVIEENSSGDVVAEEIKTRTTEIVERIAREIIPQIAERIIKEEIEKLKNTNDSE